MCIDHQKIRINSGSYTPQTNSDARIQLFSLHSPFFFSSARLPTASLVAAARFHTSFSVASAVCRFGVSRDYGGMRMLGAAHTLLCLRPSIPGIRNFCLRLNKEWATAGFIIEEPPVQCGSFLSFLSPQGDAPKKDKLLFHQVYIVRLHGAYGFSFYRFQCYFTSNTIVTTFFLYLCFVLLSINQRDWLVVEWVVSVNMATMRLMWKCLKWSLYGKQQECISTTNVNCVRCWRACVVLLCRGVAAAVCGGIICGLKYERRGRAWMQIPAKHTLATLGDSAR